MSFPIVPTNFLIYYILLTWDFFVWKGKVVRQLLLEVVWIIHNLEQYKDRSSSIPIQNSIWAQKLRHTDYRQKILLCLLLTLCMCVQQKTGPLSYPFFQTCNFFFVHDYDTNDTICKKKCNKLLFQTPNILLIIIFVCVS